MLESICTIATKHCLNELQLMLYSFRLYNKDVPIYIICDQNTLDVVKGQPNLIGQSLILDRGERADFAKADDFMSLVDKKMYALEFALSNHSSTLFVDSDMIFAGKVDWQDTTAEVLLSPHYIDKHETDKHGYYNAGYVWTNNKSFPKWWRNRCRVNKKFLEQGCLEDASMVYNHMHFGPEHNYGWFRVSPWHSCDAQIRMRELMHGEIKPISFHTHLNNTEGRFLPLNNYLKQNLNREILDYAHSIGLA